jgi:riboflavin kinase/FMN adenylyltransferase
VEVIRDLTDWPESLRSGAVSIGNFDGVHLGHAQIVERLLRVARSVNGPAVVFTFDPHPVRLLRPQQAPPPLTWTERKAELLGELGVDHVIAYPTDEALLQLSPEEFFDRIVRQRLDARAMVEGPNFYFGRGRTGNIGLLMELCGAAGVALEVVPPVEIDGDYVSSSRVRKLVQNGQVEAALHLLTRPYRLRGMVTHGSSRGHRIGFPTANIDAIDTLLPAAGVYAGRALMSNREISPAAINIGANPTFGEESLKVEVHLIDWQGTIYGQPLEVDFLARLRDIQRFDGVEQLKSQLLKDVEQTRAILNTPHSEFRTPHSHDR